MDWAGIAVSAAWTPGWGAKRGNDPWGLRLGLENFSRWWQVRRLWARGVGGLLGVQRFSEDPVHPLWSRRPRLAHGPPGTPSPDRPGPQVWEPELRVLGSSGARGWSQTGGAIPSLLDPGGDKAGEQMEPPGYPHGPLVTRGHLWSGRSPWTRPGERRVGWGRGHWRWPREDRGHPVMERVAERVPLLGRPEPRPPLAQAPGEAQSWGTGAPGSPQRFFL